MKRWWVLLMLCTLPALAGPVEEARSLMDEGRHERAAELLIDGLDAAPARAEALILLTTALNAIGDYKRGVDYGEQAVEADEKSSEAHLQYARAVRIKMQNVSKMKAMFTIGTYKKQLAKAIELDSKNVEARLEEIGFLIQAPGIAGGDKDKARRRIEEVKPLDWRQAMLMQGMLNQAEQDTDGAIATYNQMIERDGEDFEARQALAFTLQSMERYKESDVHFAALLEGDHEGRALMARYQLARSRILGEYEQQQAVDYLLGYIEKWKAEMGGLPSASHAFWRLGLAYAQLDRISDARQALERAVSLDDENKQAKEALESLGKG